MTIEKKLERVMEIGVRLSILRRVLAFNFIGTEAQEQHCDEALTLWIEFNEIVEGIESCTFQRWVAPDGMTELQINWKPL